MHSGYILKAEPRAFVFRMIMAGKKERKKGVMKGSRIGPEPGWKDGAAIYSHWKGWEEHV